MSIPQFDEIIEPNDQTEARRASLEAIFGLVGNVYPNKFVRSNISGGEDTITALKQFARIASVETRMAQLKAGLGEGERPPAEKKDELNAELKALGTVRIAGRLTTPTRGNFVHLTDGTSKLQVYCNKKGPLALIKNDGQDSLDEENGWALWQLLNHGDFIGVEGYLFVTNTGEVSVHVEKLQFLAKAMLPMPDKMHGIADPELQRRFRYADLIASTLQIEHGGLTTREVFERRAKLISGMRRFLDDAGFIEVETPMLTPKATGAVAKPFETHHNALDIPLYARVAPELYLKRLVVGGFEKVYELNRNFRNEGLSQRHNPEFTMLEFYIAYMDVNGMMDFCERMLQESVQKATGGLTVKYENSEIDFSKFERLSMRGVVSRSFPKGVTDSLFETQDSKETIVVLATLAELSRQEKSARETVLMMHEDIDKDSQFAWTDEDVKKWEAVGYFRYRTGGELFYDWNAKIERLKGKGYEEKPSTIEKLTVEIFENTIEGSLVQPTFIIDYPKSISPLSKADPSNPNIAERFELFINGMEVANGFSELNDPKEQYERFVDQMSERERGDEEAMVLDEDYIRALSYGMPPAAGIGIGIDRLVMLLTNKHSIRDVILFPHMRPEKGSLATEVTESTEGN